MRKIIILMCIIILQSCVEDSALSDVELDDPSLIKPKIELSKQRSVGSSTEHILVYLYDKNSNLIQLKAGAVLVNGEQMVVKDYLLSNGKFYSGGEVIGDIVYSKDYHFEVILSDNKSYYSQITTQETELIELNCVTEHTKTEDLQISWNKLSGSYSLNLDLQVYYLDNNSSTMKNYSIENIQRSSNGNSYSIPAHYFMENPNTEKVHITISSLVHGSVDGSFMSGSTIESINSISREVKIK